MSIVEVCADYGGVNVFHVCLKFGVVYKVGFVSMYVVFCLISDVCSWRCSFMGSVYVVCLCLSAPSYYSECGVLCL